MQGLASDTGDVVRRGWAWWTGELRGLIPGLAPGGQPAAAADLVVVVEDGQISATIPALTASPGPNTAMNTGADIGEAVLADVARRARRAAPRVLLRVPLAACLERSIDIPRGARTDAARIAALDLERSTPFRSADIWSAHCVAGDGHSDRTMRIRQFIVKRARLDPVRADLERSGARIVGADIVEADGTVLPVNLLAANAAAAVHGEPRGGTRIGWAAGALAVFGLGAVSADIWRHEVALSDLRQQTGALRERLQAAGDDLGPGGRDAGATVALARFKAERPPAVSVVESLSRSLPDTAWLTDFRLDKDAVDIMGYGRPAATLAPLVEKSPLVTTASLTAPIVADAEQQRERFSLRLKLATRAPQTGAPAAPGDGGSETDGPLALDVQP